MIPTLDEPRQARLFYAAAGIFAEGAASEDRWTSSLSAAASAA
jgi:hypothetical protein